MADVKLRCWICRNKIKDTEIAYFSFEWDCEIHKTCVYRELEIAHMQLQGICDFLPDVESIIILKEFDLLSTEEYSKLIDMVYKGKQ